MSWPWSSRQPIIYADIVNRNNKSTNRQRSLATFKLLSRSSRAYNAQRWRSSVHQYPRLALRRIPTTHRLQHRGIS